MAVSGVDTLDHANSEGVYGTITVGTTPVLLKVGASVLNKRKMITIQPNDNAVYFGYDSSVTTSTGTRVFKDQFMPLAIGPDITVYLVANDAGKVVRIGELA